MPQLAEPMLGVDVLGMDAPPDGAAAAPGAEAEEVFACARGGESKEDDEFDEIVGALEDVLLDDAFVALQAAFAEAHCGEFDDTDENKLVYTELFESYTEGIEAFLADALAARLGPGFAMERLLEVVRRRGEDELAGDVWDLLLSLSDFNEFKALMLAHKTEREGRGGALDGLLCGRGLESATR